MRWVSTRVLPEPAPATTSSGPPRWTTASSWSGFSPSVGWFGRREASERYIRHVGPILRSGCAPDREPERVRSGSVAGDRVRTRTRQRMTATGQWAWAVTSRLVDPVTSSTRPRRPRVPTTTRSASRDASISANAPVPAADDGDDLGAVGRHARAVGGPLDGVPHQRVVVGQRLLGLAARARRSARRRPPARSRRGTPRPARRPAARAPSAGRRSTGSSGSSSLVALVHADDDPAHRHPQLAADDDDRRLGVVDRRSGPSSRAAATPCSSRCGRRRRRHVVRRPRRRGRRGPPGVAGDQPALIRGSAARRPRR